DWCAGCAGAQGKPVCAGTPDTAGDPGPAGGDATGTLQSRAPAGTSATTTPADRAGPSDRALLCRGDIGFKCGVSGCTGYGGAHRADERRVHAIDRSEPGQCGGTALCRRIP